MRTVIALGGNAISGGSDGEVSVTGQRRHVRAAAEPIATLIDSDHEVVLTHGNGPQIGRLLERQEEGSLPERPLDILVVETQAQIGYLLADELDNRSDGQTTVILTRVRVDPDDPDFQEPSKPVGPYYEKLEATAKAATTTAVTTPDGERAYRRVVPSPRPLDVLEAGKIRELVEDGETVICGGVGGVPVVGNETYNRPADAADAKSSVAGPDAVADGGGVRGVAAVVDNDYTSRLIASGVDADVLAMATDVEYAYRNFGESGQRPIHDADAATMRAALADGEFAAASMRPKVEACLRFLKNGGDRAVITTPEQIVSAIDGEAGTQIRP